MATKGSYPAAGSEEPNSKQRLSWRVQVLPYLGRGRFIQPNQAAGGMGFASELGTACHKSLRLISRLTSTPQTTRPSFSRRSCRQGAKGNTVLQKDAAQSLIEVTDGTSNVILLVEANADAAVAWMRPASLPFDEANPKRGLGNLIPGGFCAAFVNGSVRFISNNIDEKTLAKLMQRDDQQQIGEPFDDHSQLISPKTVGAVSFR